MENASTKSKATTYILSVMSILLWGASYIWTDMLINLNIPVFYFVFIRILTAGVILLIYNIITNKIQKLHKRDLPIFLLMALFEPLIYFLCESYGLKETGSPTVSAMIIATIPIFTAGAGVIFFKEVLTKENIIGIFITILGIFLVVLNRSKLGENFILGICLLFAAVFAEVGYAIIAKSLSGKYNSQTIVMYQFLIGSVYLLPFFLTGGLSHFEPRYLNVEVWIPILCLALLCSSMAFTFWIRTIRILGLAKSSIFAALIPVASALIAWILGYELLSVLQWVGIFVSVSGVILSQYTKKR